MGKTTVRLLHLFLLVFSEEDGQEGTGLECVCVCERERDPLDSKMQYPIVSFRSKSAGMRMIIVIVVSVVMASLVSQISPRRRLQQDRPIIVVVER